MNRSGTAPQLPSEFRLLQSRAIKPWCHRDWKEREHSEHIKQQGSILVILGNPPYNGYAGIARIEEERGLTLAYRAGVAGLAVPQGQGLNDLYIRFFRIAERRIASNAEGQGIISFISNNAWLDGLSHTTMRHHYLHTFQQIFIDN